MPLNQVHHETTGYIDKNLKHQESKLEIHQ